MVFGLKSTGFLIFALFNSVEAKAWQLKINTQNILKRFSSGKSLHPEKLNRLLKDFAKMADKQLAGDVSKVSEGAVPPQQKETSASLTSSSSSSFLAGRGQYQDMEDQSELKKPKPKLDSNTDRSLTFFCNLFDRISELEILTFK